MKSFALRVPVLRCRATSWVRVVCMRLKCFREKTLTSSLAFVRRQFLNAFKHLDRAVVTQHFLQVHLRGKILARLETRPLLVSPKEKQFFRLINVLHINRGDNFINLARLGRLLVAARHFSVGSGNSE